MESNATLDKNILNIEDLQAQSSEVKSSDTFVPSYIEKRSRDFKVLLSTGNLWPGTDESLTEDVLTLLKSYLDLKYNPLNPLNPLNMKLKFFESSGHQKIKASKSHKIFIY